MSARYLLPCPECGTQIPVEGGRAGGTATCSCGKVIDVPRVGILRTFPQEAEATAPGGAKASEANSNWGLRQGMVLLGALLLLAGGIPALYRTITFPPAPYKTQSQVKDMADVHFDKMNLTDSWKFWKQYIEPQGLTHAPTPEEAFYERKAADLRQLISIFWAIAIVGAILIVAGFFVPGSNLRRS
jgi:hypothetical protein